MRSVRSKCLTVFLVCTILAAFGAGFIQTSEATVTYELFKTWGPSGTGYTMEVPYGLAITKDDSDYVYVTDKYLNSVLVFGLQGNYIKTLPSPEGGFNRPTGIDVDAEGNVYVMNTLDYKIEKYSKQGAHIGALVTNAAVLTNGTCIALVTSGQGFYVVDSQTSRVQYFNQETYVKQLGNGFGTGDGQFNNPFGITIDREGTIYVVDTGNNRIEKFTDKGEFLTKWGQYGSGNNDLNYPTDIAVDQQGNIYVLDLGNNRIVKYTSTGVYLTQFTTNTFKHRLVGIDVSPSGTVAIVDSDANHVQSQIVTFLPNAAATGYIRESGTNAVIPNVSVEIYLDTYAHGFWYPNSLMVPIKTDSNGYYQYQGAFTSTQKLNHINIHHPAYITQSWTYTGTATPQTDITHNFLMVKPQIPPVATQTQIDNAINNGLAYLAENQQPDGHWISATEGYDISTTATAILAFENSGHLAANPDDPYHTVVQRGLDWLISQAAPVYIGIVGPGNPDTNNNGIGITWKNGQDSFTTFTATAIMAIVGSQTPQTLATNGDPTYIQGKQYSAIVHDAVDYLSWAQVHSSTGRGGWGEGAQIASETFSTSWAVMALTAAHRWQINEPTWVKQDLSLWVTATQNLNGNPQTNDAYGGFTNTPGFGHFNVMSTAAGIIELTFLGATSTDSRIIAAQGYLNRDWDRNSADTGDSYTLNIGNLYSMLSVSQAARSANPQITTIATYTGTQGVEWYRGATEYADSLVANQKTDGSWSDWIEPKFNPYQGYPLIDTARAILTLQTPIYHLSVQVSPSGAGFIAQDPLDVNGYSEGQLVTLTATANSGYTFHHWQVGNAAPVFSNTLEYTVSSSSPTIIAWFYANQHLDVQIGPDNSGTVAQNPVDVNGYSYGQVVTLTPTANLGFTFHHWQVGNAPPVLTNSLEYTVSSSSPTIYAYFVANYHLIVNVGPVAGAGVCCSESFGYWRWRY